HRRPSPDRRRSQRSRARISPRPDGAHLLVGAGGGRRPARPASAEVVCAAMRFVVIREQGRGGDPSRPMRQQDYWPDHVEFVNGIVEDGSMLLGGPLSEIDESGVTADPTEPVGESRTYRALVVLEAEGEADLTRLLDDDPWSKHRVLETA